MSMPDKIRSFASRWGPAIVLVLTVLSAFSIVFTAAAWYTLDGRYSKKAEAEKAFTTKAEFDLIRLQLQQTIQSVESVAKTVEKHAEDKTLHMPENEKFKTFVSRVEYMNNNALEMADRDRERARTDNQFDRVLGAVNRLQDTVERLYGVGK